jgi:hypothetical protein
VRIYDLTALGKRHLAAESASWHRYATAVTRVLAPA